MKEEKSKKEHKWKIKEAWVRGEKEGGGIKTAFFQAHQSL
jgi:hypothetical protein